MPLDGYAYLVDQGWKGKGTGLRQGAIAAPLVVHPKKNLAGLGKDRDDAFPFWDHVFAAAAKSIRLTVVDSSDDEGSSHSTTQKSPHHPLARTTTGILSNRRPTSGTPIATSTTAESESGHLPGSSLLVTAKREAAKKGLYACFFRGPVLVGEVEEEQLPAVVIEEKDARTGEKRKNRATDIPPDQKSKKRRKKKVSTSSSRDTAT